MRNQGDKSLMWQGEHVSNEPSSMRPVGEARAVIFSVLKARVCCPDPLSLKDLLP